MAYKHAVTMQSSNPAETAGSWTTNNNAIAKMPLFCHRKEKDV